MVAKAEYFSVKDRRAAKQRSRDADERRLASGQVSPRQLKVENGLFSVLDPSKARILLRRVAISLA
ncbi:hypothetical protein [Tianweitania sediminis]|uniref:Uncharacterized protein n=1 Tax=Tianweitania sediminis TaxID=1502156 RepID=A0A8J7QZY4_9HYPH|nr:hypothetical protein [Tianweitania sediminis]MBP0437983.1 hypothetical protein [Tianweitania sediminis]